MSVSKFVPGALAASLVTIVITTPFTAPAQSANSWVNRALGSYDSKILNAGSITPGVTEFTRSQDGSLSGSYLLYESEGDVPGMLSACQAVKPLVMRCTWQDKYGKGHLEVTFSKDFSSFVGNWAPGTSKPVYRWNGSRLHQPKFERW